MKCAWLLPVITLVIALASLARAQAGAGPLLEDTRAGALVEPGNASRTVGEAVAVLVRASKLPLEVSVDIRDNSLVLAGVRRPAAEYLQALAAATRCTWRKTKKGFLLTPEEKAAPAPGTPIDLAEMPALQRTIAWPRAELQQAPGQVPAYSAFKKDAFGAAALGVAAECGVSLVAYTPALTRQYFRSRTAGELTGKAGLLALEKRTGGRWVRIGETLALVRPAADVAREQQPETTRMRQLAAPSTELFSSLSRKQVEQLKAGRTVPFAELTAPQRTAFRNLLLQHYALTGLYDRGLLDQPESWSLKPEREEVGVTIGTNIEEHQVSSLDLNRLPPPNLQP